MSPVYQKKWLLWRWLPPSLRSRLQTYLRLADKLWDHFTKLGHREGVSHLTRLFSRFLHSLVLSCFSIEYNQIPIRAAALTYTTILGLIPFVIILTAVAGRFGYLGLLERFVPYIFDSLNLDLPLEPILTIIRQAETLNFNRIGLVGTIGLLISFVLFMTNIEKAIDHIWSVRKPRNLWQSLKVYMPFLFLLLILVGVSASFLIRLQNFMDAVEFPQIMPALRHGAVLVFGGLALTVFIWVGISLLIYIMPNTKVFKGPAIAGASVSAALIFFLTRAFIFFPGLITSKNNVVLGSLAFLPALLVFIYFVWSIVLFGATVGFVWQSYYRVEDEDDDTAEDAPFHMMEREVLEVVGAIERLATSVKSEIDQADHTTSGVALVSREALAETLALTPEQVEQAATPLKDLKWLRREIVGQEVCFILERRPEHLDLVALHALLVRLNPSGTGDLRNLSWLEEIRHNLSLLYSHSTHQPPLKLSSAQGLRDS